MVSLFENARRLPQFGKSTGNLIRTRSDVFKSEESDCGGCGGMAGCRCNEGCGGCGSCRSAVAPYAGAPSGVGRWPYIKGNLGRRSPCSSKRLRVSAPRSASGMTAASNRAFVTPLGGPAFGSALAGNPMASPAGVGADSEPCAPECAGKQQAYDACFERWGGTLAHCMNEWNAYQACCDCGPRAARECDANPRSCGVGKEACKYGKQNICCEWKLWFWEAHDACECCWNLDCVCCGMGDTPGARCMRACLLCESRASWADVSAHNKCLEACDRHWTNRDEARFRYVVMMCVKCNSDSCERQMMESLPLRGTVLPALAQVRCAHHERQPPLAKNAPGCALWN